MNRNVLIRIATNPPARLWSGLADLYIPADGTETVDGALYLGGGEVIDGLNEVEQLINGTASRIDVAVSGVAAATVKLALEEAEDVKGALVDIGVIEFDDFWQIVSVTWTAQYRADKLSINRKQDQRTITLSMGTDDTGRSRTTNAYWTHADQQRRSPGDMFFNQVASINAGTSRAFGPS